MYRLNFFGLSTQVAVLIRLSISLDRGKPVLSICDALCRIGSELVVVQAQG
jgi:hypothetical protein